MHLKKGDVVAIVATVVEEQSAKVEVSINGAEIDAGLLVPVGVLRLLERSASHGDKVILPDGKKGTFFQALNDNVVIVLLDGADERDPSSYVNVLRENLRNQNQEGVVQFAPIKKPVAGAETGRDILDATAGNTDTGAEDADQADRDNQEELNAANLVIDDSGSDDSGSDGSSPKENTKIQALEPSVDFEFPIQLGGKTAPETEESDLTEEAFDNNGEEAADEITVEMPDAPLPRRPVPSPIGDTIEETLVEEAEGVNGSEEVSAESEETVETDEITPSEVTSASERENAHSDDASAPADDEVSSTLSADENEASSSDEALRGEDGQSEKHSEDEAAKDASDKVEANSISDTEAVETPEPEPEPEPTRDPERTAHLESMKKDMLAGIREQEGHVEDAEEEGDDIFSSIDSLDKRMS